MSFTNIRGGGSQQLQITAEDMQDMASHWLGCPVNGYFGDDYGNSAKSLLQSPLTGVLADGFVAKLREDVPLIARLDRNQVNIYMVDAPPDVKHIYLEIANTQLEITG